MYQPQHGAMTTGQQTKRCRYCSEEILASAQKCKHCGEFLSPIARRAAGVPRKSTNAGSVKIPMGEAVLCLFFFLPLGVAALIFASQADARLKSGDISGAATAATTAKNLSAFGFVIGLLFATWFIFAR